MIKKHVLLIAYFYPPFGQTSSRRSGCMAKYLPQCGWRPFVLTRKWTPDNGPFDPTITMEIPSDVVVHEVVCDTVPSSLTGRLLKRINQTIHPQMDPIEFFRVAADELPSLIRRFEINAIWATFPPLSNLTLADQVSRITGKPWIADFRDVNQFVDSVGEALMRPMRLFYERQILKSASRVVAVSDGFAETLRQRHGRMDIKVIPNGFDPDILQPEQNHVSSKFEIVYTGGINLGRPDFTMLLDALQYLCIQGKMCTEDVLISFYGAENERRLKILMRHPFGKFIRNNGAVPRSEALRRQREALILLQSTVPGTGWMTSKIYEYLVARRPILAFPRDIDTIEKLLQETNAGVSCSTMQEISEQLIKWYIEWKTTGTIKWHGNIQAIMQYSRKAQAEQTAQLLDDIVCNHELVPHG